MKTPMTACLLRVFIGSDDRYQGKPLAEAIVLKAREMGLAGATVLHGQIGYGAHSRLHTTRVLRLSEDLPMLIEIVDRRERIDTFLPVLDEMVDEGLVTMENVEVLWYRSGNDKEKPV